MTTRDKALAREPDGGARTQDLGAEQRVLMRLRVSHDSGRTWGRVTEVLEDQNPVILDNPIGFPPCACARCMDNSYRSEASPRVVS
ncbi:hypothetical protein AB0945_06685 [Streptomyces sp. NPDC005474]|uniref:hypothetical protein n=1 Tax=Streptomyces sp. NPDC005474 TaxID=3154878 RepID=UPI003453389D